MTSIQRMEVRLPRDLHEWVRTEAFEKRISMHSIMLRAMRELKERDSGRAVAETGK